MPHSVLIIGTRGSKLALAQTALVQGEIRRRHHTRIAACLPRADAHDVLISRVSESIA